MFANVVYILCAVTSIGCAVLLLRAYLRVRSRLLMWSSLCFVGLGLNNVLLWVDKVALPETDLSIFRSGTALASVLVLLVGLIWEGTE